MGEKFLGTVLGVDEVVEMESFAVREGKRAGATGASAATPNGRAEPNGEFGEARTPRLNDTITQSTVRQAQPEAPRELELLSVPQVPDRVRTTCEHTFHAATSLISTQPSRGLRPHLLLLSYYPPTRFLSPQPLCGLPPRPVRRPRPPDRASSSPLSSAATVHHPAAPSTAISTPRPPLRRPAMTASRSSRATPPSRSRWTTRSLRRRARTSPLRAGTASETRSCPTLADRSSDGGPRWCHRLLRRPASLRSTHGRRATPDRSHRARRQRSAVRRVLGRVARVSLTPTATPSNPKATTRSRGSRVGRRISWTRTTTLTRGV